MKVALEATASGVVLPVRAQAGARRDGIRGVHDGALKVSVTQAAEKGKANEALTEVLARSLGLRRGQVALIGGATSGRKRFLIRDTTCGELARRIDQALEALG